MIDDRNFLFMLSGPPGAAANRNEMPGHQRRQQRWREQKRRQPARKRRAEMLDMEEVALDTDWELPQLQRQPPPPRTLTLVRPSEVSNRREP